MSTEKNKKKKLLFGTTQDQAEGFKTAAGIANQLAGLSSQIADASPAKKYRQAGVDTGNPVRTGTEDKNYSAAMSTTTEYDRSDRQTAVKEDLGTDINGKDILTKKEKKLLEESTVGSHTFRI